MAVHALLQSVLLVNVMNANPREAFVSRSLAICTETKQQTLQNGSYTTDTCTEVWRHHDVLW